MAESLNILWEDDCLLVAEKKPGINSESTSDRSGLPDLLMGEHGNYIAPIHRLDLGVGGALLCAKTPKAAALLSKAVAEGGIEKEYLALAHGELPESGSLENLLFYDRKAGKSFVVDRKRNGVKTALLTFETLQCKDTPWGPISLLRVFPKTGRTHQIRVQFAHIGHPLLGDRKYGAAESAPLGLCCSRLTFLHPATGKPLSVSFAPTGGAWDLFPFT